MATSAQSALHSLSRALSWAQAQLDALALSLQSVEAQTATARLPGMTGGDGGHQAQALALEPYHRTWSCGVTAQGTSDPLAPLLGGLDGGDLVATATAGPHARSTGAPAASATPQDGPLPALLWALAGVPPGSSAASLRASVDDLIV